MREKKMKMLIGAIAILVMLVASLGATLAAMASTAMATAPLLPVEGWLKGYSDVIHSRYTPPESHYGLYADGYAEGWNTAMERPSKVKDIRYIDGWLAGWGAKIHELPRNITGHTLSYTRGFYAGYDAPDGAAVPNVDPKALGHQP